MAFFVERGLLPLSLCFVLSQLVACGGDEWGRRAPFDAEAPPETWTPPNALATVVDELPPPPPAPPMNPAFVRGRHVYGADAYPCTGHPVCDEPSPADGALRVVSAAPEEIDPSLVHDPAGILVAQNLFEPLLTYPPGNGEPVPGVAERWELADDRVTYTFYLDRDAHWTNRRRVTAYDFVYAWTRKLRPETGSKSADHLFFIRNARAFNEGRLTDPGELGIEALDNTTLRVTLEKPTPYWLHYVKTVHYAPVPQEAVAVYEERWTEPENIVSNGPYELARVDDAGALRLVRSPTWRDADSVRIPSVVISPATTPEEDLRRYDAGELHLYHGRLTPDALAALIASGRPDLAIDPLLCIYWYPLRLDKPPLDNPLVRMAIDLAIDKERLVREVTRGLQQPADGVVPPYFQHSHGYSPPPRSTYDPFMAALLLGEAGFPNGIGLPPVSILVDSLDTHAHIAEFVGRALKENLGMDIVVERLPWRQLLKRLRTGDFRISRYGRCDVPDPYGFLETFRAGSANNVMGYRSPELERILDASLRAADPADRMELLSRAEAVVLRDVPVIPIYHYTRAYLKKPVLRGHEPELGDTHLFRYMYWGDREERTP